MRAKVGEPYKIKIPFKGSPIPDVTWFNVIIPFDLLHLEEHISTMACILPCQGPKQITDDGRITFEVKDGEAILTCKSAEKGDAGKASKIY